MDDEIIIVVKYEELIFETPAFKVQSVCGRTSTSIEVPTDESVWRKVVDGSAVAVTGQFKSTNENCPLISVSLSPQSALYFTLEVEEDMTFTVTRTDNTDDD